MAAIAVTRWRPSGEKAWLQDLAGPQNCNCCRNTLQFSAVGGLHANGVILMQTFASKYIECTTELPSNRWHRYC
jgi:hypothetical protein